MTNAADYVSSIRVISANSRLLFFLNSSEFAGPAYAEDVRAEIIPAKDFFDVILIKAEIHHEHTSDKGKVHACEFETGSLFRSIQFPKKVDPNKVNAEFKNGMLYLTAAVAGEAHLRKVEVKAS